MIPYPVRKLAGKVAIDAEEFARLARALSLGDDHMRGNPDSERKGTAYAFGVAFRQLLHSVGELNLEALTPDEKDK